MHEQKVLFFDVDGTIVPGDDHVIPESAKEALCRAHDKGHRLVVNTGRPYGHVESQIKALPFDGYICSLGGFILWEGRELAYQKPSREVCFCVRELAKECRMSALYESEQGAFSAVDRSNPYACKDHDWLVHMGVPVWDQDAEDFSFDKFVCWPMEGADQERFCRELSGEFDFIHREHRMLEVVGKGLTKAGGMERLAQLLHFRREDTYAFGDGPNDLAMLHQAGTSVLMGNAPRELWPQADYVTAPLKEDGLYKALAHFNLI